MSCNPGEQCHEDVKRRRALLVLALMALIFLALSAVSFLDSRGQTVPSAVQYAGFDAIAGKRVFQSYNCMGCHTIVGNGAYFGPDLTKLYDRAGPAWLAAFLPSAGSWPTNGAVRLQLLDKAVAVEAGVESMEAYLEKYPAAAERIARRGGQASHMPNLPISRQEVHELIAFLKYTSAMNTEGWPPVPKVDGLTFPMATPMPVAAQKITFTSSEGAGQAVTSPVSTAARGAELAEDNGCTACHAPTAAKVVGPGWGGLYGSTVQLADGSSVIADDSYLTEKILNPDARVVAGYQAGLMPAFAEILDKNQVGDIVAYIRSLGGN
ncbi:nitric oxide reductase NorC [Steroidobacter denitrificans]|uniref:Nitric oxide reductase NorC n=1 Tax=Steroidobacter denitrificans TaxID=465721 RepID=A0A127F8S8_STEDE|nr:c-type cytochrome [Steroidobacter denitrificans]AMN46041.1 nitric oxide reductase NorC [Steroidobacter denitrificans]